MEGRQGASFSRPASHQSSSRDGRALEPSSPLLSSPFGEALLSEPEVARPRARELVARPRQSLPSECTARRRTTTFLRLLRTRKNRTRASERESESLAPAAKSEPARANARVSFSPSLSLSLSAAKSFLSS